MKVLSVFGTRPEAIKMAPLVNLLAKTVGIESLVCVTAQHRTMLDQVLALFDIKPHHDLNVMRPNQSLSDLTIAIMQGVSALLDEVRPDLVLVHGDTTTSFVTSLASFYKGIRVGHIEAGLRTNNLLSPWPEEANRQLTSRIASLHFAPTKLNRGNLLKEGVDENSILVTGNTVIDALIETCHQLDKQSDLLAHCENVLPALDDGRRTILVTGHRRENFGQGFANLCEALLKIAEDEGVQIIYPVHLNPSVQSTVRALLSGRENILLVDPLDYAPFVQLMRRAHIIVTDSGGIQEEAPSLGKPVIVTRDTTERTEALDAGTIRLVGTNCDAIHREVRRLLDNPGYYETMAQTENPYGDGHASERIVNALIHEAQGYRTYAPA